MSEPLKRAVADQWMQDHRVPGKYIDLLWDPPPGKKTRTGQPLKRYGKCLFIVDDVVSHEGQSGKAPQICIVDVTTDKDGGVRRKPNRVTQRAGTGAGRFNFAYHQVFLPLDRIAEITDALRRLAGCEVAVELKRAEAGEQVKAKEDAVGHEIEEFFKSKLGGGS